MKRLLVLLALVACLGAPAAGTAPHTTSPEELVALASHVAQRPVNVLCYAPGEYVDEDRFDPYDYAYSWGFVLWKDRQTIHLAAEVCDGAVAIAHDDDSVPKWKQALGIEVLVHEALHSNRWEHWKDEAMVECFALKRLRPMARLLGAEKEELDDLLAYSLAEFWRIADLFPKYHLRGCKLPYFFPPEGPRG